MRLTALPETSWSLNFVVYLSSRLAGHIAGLLFVGAFLLVLSSVATQVLHRSLEPGGALYGATEKLTEAFYVNNERNFPTLYSSYLLLLNAHILAAIALLGRASEARHVWRWALLSVTFLYLCVDEAVSIHEMTIEPLRSLLGAGGVLYFTWILPAAGLVMVFALLYYGFLLDLPSPVRGLFVAAAVTYLAGAIGMEMVSGYLWESSGENSPIVVTLVTIEEFLEMCGAIVFAYALLRYLGMNLGKVSFAVSEPALQKKEKTRKRPDRDRDASGVGGGTRTPTSAMDTSPSS